jgi:hypothetical protein
MDMLDQFAAELRQQIENDFADNPELRDLWLRVTEQEVERVRREDAELARPRRPSTLSRFK